MGVSGLVLRAAVEFYDGENNLLDTKTAENMAVG